MRLKTYHAPTMSDAYAQVKKDLGKDAVILHTRSYKVGGFFGFGGKNVVEITASDDPRAVAPRQIRRATQASPQAPAPADAVAPRSSAVARAYSAAGARLQQPSPEPPVAADTFASPGLAAVRDVARLALAEQPQHARPNVAAVDQALHAELAAIKRMVGQVLQTRTVPTLIAASDAASANAAATLIAAPAPCMPEALLRHYMRLIENEVAREVADQMVAAVRDELTPAELADEGVVRQTILRQLESLLPATDTAKTPGRAPDGRPTTIALIGPTGVGKTTTIAKLAAAHRLRHGRKVGLITSDTYRIAAVDQLRTYANIIGVPLKVVLTPEEMSAARDELRDMDVILIDTAGRSPSDERRLDELRAFLAAADPHQTHLVLSSVASEGAIHHTVERFAPLAPTNVIFTKLDEAASFGVLVNVARRLTARLSYVTTGQEVPDDIEPSRPDRLARLILDGQHAA